MAYIDDLRRWIKDKTDEEKIKYLKNLLFLIQQDNYMNREHYYACKNLLKELGVDAN